MDYVVCFPYSVLSVGIVPLKNVSIPAARVHWRMRELLQLYITLGIRYSSNPYQGNVAQRERELLAQRGFALGAHLQDCVQEVFVSSYFSSYQRQKLQTQVRLKHDMAALPERAGLGYGRVSQAFL